MSHRIGAPPLASPPRIALRWRMLALLFAARCGLGLQFQTMASTGDGLTSAFGLDQAAIGMMIGLFMAPGLVLTLPAGLAGRHATDRVLAGTGLALLAAGGIVSGLAQGPAGLGAGRLLAGAGFLLSNLYFTKMIADWFEGKEIATAMSILVMSWPLGIAAGQVGHAILVEAFGWRLPFLVASVWCAVMALAVLRLYQPPVTARGAAAPSFQLTGREWVLILCAGFAWGVFNAGYIVWLSFAPKMLEVLGAGALAAAATISLASWLMIGSGAVCGQIADRTGRRDLILIVAMIAGAGALWLVQVPGGALGASLMLGLLGVAPAGLIMALTGQAVAQERRAFGMGIFFTVYFAAQTVVPPVAGALYDRTGTPETALSFGAVLFLAVLPAVFAFRRISTAGR